MMKNVYENVWPNKTLRDLISIDEQTPENLVASIGLIGFPVVTKMHYSGPGNA